MPGIGGQRLADGLLRVGLDGEGHADLVSERPAEDEEAFLGEVVHVRRVRVPACLLVHRLVRIPLRAGTAPDDEEHGHVEGSTKAGRRNVVWADRDRSSRLEVVDPCGADRE